MTASTEYPNSPAVRLMSAGSVLSAEASIDSQNTRVAVCIWKGRSLVRDPPPSIACPRPKSHKAASTHVMLFVPAGGVKYDIY